MGEKKKRVFKLYRGKNGSFYKKQQKRSEPKAVSGVMSLKLDFNEFGILQDIKMCFLKSASP